MNVTVTVRRSGDWWAIEVLEVVGVFTQAKRLDQVAAMAADAVAVMLDIDPDQVNVTMHIDVPDAIASELAQLAALDALLDEKQAQAHTLRRAVVAQLRDSEGLTVRDVARLVNLSPQRISQLMKRPHVDA